MSEFNPSDPKYKKVEDLPKEEQGNFTDVDGGFVGAEAKLKFDKANKLSLLDKLFQSGDGLTKLHKEAIGEDNLRTEKSRKDELAREEKSREQAVIEEKSAIDVDEIARNTKSTPEKVDETLGYPSLWKKYKVLSETQPALTEILDLGKAVFERNVDGLDQLVVQSIKKQYPDLRPSQFINLPLDQIAVLKKVGLLEQSIRAYPTEVPPEQMKQIVSLLVKWWDDENATALLVDIHHAHLQECGNDLDKLVEYYRVMPQPDLTHSSNRVVVPHELRDELGHRLYEMFKQKIVEADTPEELSKIAIPDLSFWGVNSLHEYKQGHARAMRESKKEKDDNLERERILKAAEVYKK